MSAVKQQVITVASMFVNAFIVRGERCIIVDTGIPGYGARILKAMNEHSIKPDDVSLIVITHGHTDHFGSAADLRQKTGAPLAIHREDADSIRFGSNPELIPVGRVGKVMAGLSGMMKTPALKGVEPDILIESETDLARYGVKGKIIPTPGHTPGSLSVFLEEGYALVGDLLAGGFMVKGAPGLPFFAHDVAGISRSVQRLLNLRPDIFYAGHGGPFSAVAVRDMFSAKA